MPRFARALQPLSLILSLAAATSQADTAPRNVIFFLGDGMGVSTVTAARILAGQQAGGSGEEHALSFEAFPNVALIKTYNTDAQVADSAGTMSALMSGEKTRIGHISVGPEVAHDDCAASLAQPQKTLLEMAAEAGLVSGVVSTARLTHATPAATFAHVPNRDWESDADLPAQAVEEGCRDIARQLLESPHLAQVRLAVGGGRRAFLPADQSDPEYPELTGARRDGRDLTAEWLAGSDQRRYVWNAEQWSSLQPGDASQILALFEPSHMQYETDRANDAGGEPSLAEMTAFAIEHLEAAGTGYFLMIEGGRIDHGHHAGNAHRALVDTIAFAEAVSVALARVDLENTLILVTADHSHTLTLSGYPRRGNPILGTVVTPLGELGRDAEGRAYTTLNYANGPGHRPLEDLDDVDTQHPDYRQHATFPLYSETHAGEDVPAYAIGRGAEAVRGVMEQHRLFDVMRDALGLSGVAER